jgi:hypothetical protein
MIEIMNMIKKTIELAKLNPPPSTRKAILIIIYKAGINNLGSQRISSHSFAFVYTYAKRKKATDSMATE